MTPTRYGVDPAPRPGFATALMRGLQRRCPACGIGHSFRAYLKVADACGHCGEPLGHIRADDMPPYFTIFIVGHVIVALVLMVEQSHAPALWLQMLVWPTLTLLMTLALLPYVKGGVVGAMWALGLARDEQLK